MVLLIETSCFLQSAPVKNTNIVVLARALKQLLGAHIVSNPIAGPAARSKFVERRSRQCLAVFLV
jgi:hypothetical protein